MRFWRDSNFLKERKIRCETQSNSKYSPREIFNAPFLIPNELSKVHGDQYVSEKNKDE